VLAVCCVSVLLVGIDITAVNLALPSIGRDFHTGATGLSWIIDAYTLVLASFLMFSAWTADRIGRKLVFRIGLAVFMLGSALCALAPSLGWLIAFRALQGLGGSMLNPVAMAILSSVYPKPADRAKAIGVWSGVIGLSLALGPIVGGALVDSPLGWRGIFLINVPIGLAAIVVATKVTPESKAARPRRADLPGQVLIALLLAGLVFGVIEGPKLGWDTPAIVAALAVAADALAAFLAVESRRSEPLLDPRFFRSVPCSAANLIAVFSFASLGAFLYLNSIYLQEARGYSPLDAGLLMLPLAVVSVLWGPRNGKILAKHGSPHPVAHRRRRPDRCRGDPHPGLAHHPDRLAAGRLRTHGPGQLRGRRPHHPHRRRGNAARAGGCRGRRQLRDPPDRSDCRRRHRRGHPRRRQFLPRRPRRRHAPRLDPQHRLRRRRPHPRLP
jgi:EmrB/QacA subfamily drug resistance transporter